MTNDCWAEGRKLNDSGVLTFDSIYNGCWGGVDIISISVNTGMIGSRIRGECGIIGSRLRLFHPTGNNITDSGLTIKFTAP